MLVGHSANLGLTSIHFHSHSRTGTTDKTQQHVTRKLRDFSVKRIRFIGISRRSSRTVEVSTLRPAGHLRGSRTRSPAATPRTRLGRKGEKLRPLGEGEEPHTHHGSRNQAVCELPGPNRLVLTSGSCRLGLPSDSPLLSLTELSIQAVRQMFPDEHWDLEPVLTIDGTPLNSSPRSAAD